MARHRTVPRVAALVVLVAGPVLAQEPETGLTRTLELRAHQALIDRIARPDTGLAPFETDGCSGGLSQVWGMVSARFPEFAETYEAAPPWEACCFTHDRAYHAAAEASTAEESYDARVLADAELRSCVNETGRLRRSELAEQYGVTPDRVELAYGLIADAMHLAVRFGGGPCSGLSWRWGYGYPNCSVLQTLTGD